MSSDEKTPLVLAAEEAEEIAQRIDASFACLDAQCALRVFRRRLALGSHRILLVEDEAEHAALTARVIKLACPAVTVEVASTVEGALQAINHTPGFCGGIVDWRLGTERGSPIVACMIAASIPRVIWTNYASDIKDEDCLAPVISKAKPEVLTEWVKAVTGVGGRCPRLDDIAAQETQGSCRI